MSLGDLLDEAFQLYRGNFLVFLGIAGLAYVPFILVIGVLAAILAATSVLSLLSRGFGSLSDSQQAGLMLAGGLSAIAIFVAYIIVFSLMSGALSVAISRRYLRYPITILESYRIAGRRLLALVGTQLLFILLCLLMSITLIGIPFAIFFAVRWILFAPVTVLEGAHGGMTALKRSSALIRGSWWRTVGVLVVVSIIINILSSITSSVISVATLALVSGIAGQIVRQIVSAMVSIVFTPLSAAVVTLLFYDYKIRKEAFDLETLARHHAELPGSEVGTVPTF
jgi:hypothetical protein